MGPGNLVSDPRGATPPKVVAYVRVSTEEQVQGYSIQAQIEAVKKVCEQRGWRFLKAYDDPGESGSNFERPGFIEMLDDAERRMFDLVLVTNIDRLSREPLHSFMAINTLEKHGARLAVTNLPDVTSNMKEFYAVYSPLIGISKFFLMDLREKTKMGIDQARKEGKHLGRPRKGFTVGRSGFLEPDDLGRQGLRELELNPSLKAVKLAEILGLKHKQAWELLNACRLYVSRVTVVPPETPTMSRLRLAER